MTLTQLHDQSEEALKDRLAELKADYEQYRTKNLKLDMSRGKPSPEQLELSMPMLDVLSSKSAMNAENGVDTRNYGQLDGIPEAKRFFADLLGVETEEVIVGGNSSLNLMHDTIMRGMVFGFPESSAPWSKQGKIKFICPVPGYDRHFAICELFGIEMIQVAINEEGPDMDEVERLVREDDSIKGMWCVPKYSNPSGSTYSDETVERLVSMEAKANDFRLFWDDAYTVHHLTDEHDSLKNVLDAAKEAGQPNRPIIFASTSKVTFPGSGVSVIAAARDNIAHFLKLMSSQTIGYDKINQLQHVRFFTEVEPLEAHMKKHAKLIKPKFELVLSTLEEKLGGKGIASWSKPNGGYFISLDVVDGAARKTVTLAKEVGVTLTGAGAAFPYGIDPRDRNIRIAPTFPAIDELKEALNVLCTCVEIASIEQLLANK